MNTYKVVNLTGGGGSDDRRVKISTDDTSAGFLEEKILAESSKVVITTENPGAAELLKVDVDETNIDHNILLNYDIDEHRTLDDASTTTTSLWSSDKIQSELDTKINAATPMTDNKLVKSIGTSGVDVEATGIDVDDSNNVTGINNLTIDGNLTVNGTTTTIDSTELVVADANVTVNSGGTQASADTGNAGLTIEMSDATDVELGYDSTTASKMKLGEIGSQHEIITTNHTQTLLNKTINVDNNTVSNIETDNLKSGVLQTDISGAVSDTNLASSQAIVTYVTDQLALQDDASEITYTPSVLADWDSSTDPGNVDGGLDQLAERTTDVETSLSSHLNADPSKHNANQINNTPSGNLAATDVQAALDELQSDVDTRALASDLTDHLNDIADAHDASAISNVPAGNIAATDVQSAINELDTEKYIAANFNSDFDTRLGTKDTDDIAEGTNLYHTDERSQDSVGSILVDTASIDLNYDDVTPQITATVLPAGVDHDSLANYDANDHIDHTTVSISAGEGLSGGGDISANRSLALDITGLASTTIDPSDELVLYDVTATGHRKVTVGDIASVGSSSGDLSEGSQAIAESASGANVTGLAFANATVRSFVAQISVEIDAASDLFEEFEIHGIQKSAGWDISISSEGDETLISFDISAAGQVTYSSSTYTTFVSGTIKYRARVTTK